MVACIIQKQEIQNLWQAISLAASSIVKILESVPSAIEANHLVLAFAAHSTRLIEGFTLHCCTCALMNMCLCLYLLLDTILVVHVPG